MSDPRLDSAHLGFLSRRQDYRRARTALLQERGWLTLCGQNLDDLAGEGDDSSALLPFRPGQLLPGAKFLLVDREGNWSYPLRTGVNTVGRLPNNDVVLGEPGVSRRHCVLLLHARGGCELHDTASLNGTFVNGQRVWRPVRLASGDWIQIDARLLLFISENDYEAAARQEDDHPETIVR